MDLFQNLLEDQNFQEFLNQNPAVKFLPEPKILELFQEWIAQKIYQTQDSVLVPKKLLELIENQTNLIIQMSQQLLSHPISVSGSEYPEEDYVWGGEPDVGDHFDPFSEIAFNIEDEVASLTESSEEEPEVTQGETNAD